MDERILFFCLSYGYRGGRKERTGFGLRDPIDGFDGRTMMLHLRSGQLISSEEMW